LASAAVKLRGNTVIIIVIHVISDAETNLKVGAPVRRESGEHRSGAKRRKFFFGRAPLRFSSRSTISRFDECFRDGQYSMAVSCWLFFYLTVPPCPMESAPLHAIIIS